MTTSRRYVSPVRDARAADTRDAILEAFVEQLAEGRESLSPKDAAGAAGVSVRTVHTHFPDRRSQVRAVAEHLDAMLYPEPTAPPSGAGDIGRYLRDVHTVAVTHPLAAVLLRLGPGVWDEIRAERRAHRLEALRAAVRSIGAPARVTRETSALLEILAGGEVSLALVERHGISRERAPQVIADAAETILADVRDRTD